MTETTLRGMIQVYTGEGKGKTTAALGLAMRAVGHGRKVYMIQFLKGGPTKDRGDRLGQKARAVADHQTHGPGRFYQPGQSRFQGSGAGPKGPGSGLAVDSLP